MHIHDISYIMDALLSQYNHKEEKGISKKHLQIKCCQRCVCGFKAVHFTDTMSHHLNSRLNIRTNHSFAGNNRKTKKCNLSTIQLDARELSTSILNEINDLL